MKAFTKLEVGLFNYFEITIAFHKTIEFIELFKLTLKNLLLLKRIQENLLLPTCDVTFLKLWCNFK